MNTQKKQAKEPKPLLTNSLYSVWKRGQSYVVTLASNPQAIQYTGMKMFAMAWAEENGL